MQRILHITACTYTGGGVIKKIVNIVTNDIQNQHHILFIWYSVPFEKCQKMINYLTSLEIKFNFIYRKNFFKSILPLHLYLKENKFEILHYYSDNLSLMGHFVKLLGNHTQAARSLEGFPTYYAYPIRKLVNWALSSCENFIAISHAVADSYIEMYPAIKKETCTVIYNAPINVECSNSNIEKREGLLCIGTLTEQKQIAVAIHTIERLLNVYQRPLSLYILGEGDEKQTLIKLAKELGVSDLVKFIGVVDNPCPYFNRCRIFLHPAYNEGFGLVVVEAMYANIVVLGANSGALPEIIKDQESGFLLPLKSPDVWAKKINEIYDDITLLKQMGNRAHDIVIDRFSQNQHIRGYVNFYNSIK